MAIDPFEGAEDEATDPAGSPPPQSTGSQIEAFDGAEDECTDPAGSPPPPSEGHLACTFSFTCPQRWSRLTPTDEPTRRHCTECDKDVHLVWTQELYDEAAEQGRCVAVIVRAGTGSYVAHQSPPESDARKIRMGKVAPPQK